MPFYVRVVFKDKTSLVLKPFKFKAAAVHAAERFIEGVAYAEAYHSTASAPQVDLLAKEKAS